MVAIRGPDASGRPQMLPKLLPVPNGICVVLKQQMSYPSQKRNQQYKTNLPSLNVTDGAGDGLVTAAVKSVPDPPVWDWTSGAEVRATSSMGPAVVPGLNATPVVASSSPVAPSISGTVASRVTVTPGTDAAPGVPAAIAGPELVASTPMAVDAAVADGMVGISAKTVMPSSR